MSYPSDLFRAIFTPGAPPALLLATNVSFACLQLTLLVMLFSTGSFHFFFLSVICGGVWGGINWFVAEVEKLKKVEEQAEEIRRVQGELEGEETERRQEGEEDDGRSTGIQLSASEHIERRKSVSEDEWDDGFEKVEKEDGYETDRKKSQ